MALQPLRGSKESLLHSIIETLKLVKKLPDEDIRDGIQGVINRCEKVKNEFKKTRKK